MSEIILDKTAGEIFDKIILAIKDQDDEVAHGLEDKFRARCLLLISQGHPNSVELAKWALSTEQLSFCRWCA